MYLKMEMSKKAAGSCLQLFCIIGVVNHDIFFFHFDFVKSLRYHYRHNG